MMGVVNKAALGLQLNVRTSLHVRQTWMQERSLLVGTVHDFGIVGVGSPELDEEAHSRYDLGSIGGWSICISCVYARRMMLI